MKRFEDIDWFTDPEVHQDPYPYYAWLRSRGPVVRLPHYNVVAVTDYDAIVSTFWDSERFSSVIASGGPLPPLPFAPEGEDITAQIEANRARMPRASLLVALDPPDHMRHRSLLTGLMTPYRFKQNERFIARLAGRLLDGLHAGPGFEAVADLAHPFAVLVVADLMGVPEAEHPRLLTMLPAQSGQLGKPLTMHDPHAELAEAFRQLVAERRERPRGDALSQLANARFPDGKLPAIDDLVHLASVMFSAGQDGSVRLIATALKLLGELPDLQRELRAHPARLPAFIEEALRFDAPSKLGFRLARVPVEVCGERIAPGTVLMLMTAATHRDPARFERPDEIILDRPNIRDHLAFGRGAHTCIGASLARAETRILLELLLERTSDLGLSEAGHGPPGARRFAYVPRYTTRGLTELHLEAAWR